ncbi:MAG: tRNA (adenosine(37)-N6)-threonylcarbamoyltransferase complex dimerization subunit type 1 TsaB [Rhodobacterales bacterium]|nr:MAG: tRNA (adenosine(37)-N6)-threonylcarbamoyltransferase complex dimerization subunit type 1 TsaB [Rhodobacterales bacterium]
MRPDPVVLGFDTSAAHCAAALLAGGDIVAARVEEMQRGQAERLMPLLEELLSEAGCGWADLDALGVGIGPGNFTGIRIAVAAARGLALGLGKPAIGVDGFEARSFGKTPPFACLVPAPRGAVYRVEMHETGASDPVLQPRPDAALGLTVLPEPPVATQVENIARAAACRCHVPQPRPAPLYLRAADAAPPRDPAPVILP